MRRVVLILLLVLTGCTSNNSEVKSLELDGHLDKDLTEGTTEICETKLFEYPPVDIERTLVMLPLGLMTGSHVTPIDHHYFQNFENDLYDIEVYSPADGIITDVQHMPGAPYGEDYRVVIDHGCGVSSIYIHLGVFSEEFLGLAPETVGKEYHRVDVPVKAGQLIGYYMKNIDYNIVDESITLTGFVNKESYKAEPWKEHVPDTYLYFNEEVREDLYSISLRQVEPRSGKIDYDVEGALIGNWFIENSNGYSGDSTSMDGYWLGHLAIAYDAYDPNRIVLSIGGYLGENSRQFAVKGNTPDPKDVTQYSGLVKYELVEYDWYYDEGTLWNRWDFVKGLYTLEYDYVHGVVLVEVLPDNQIMFEVFPNKSLEDVSTFTDNANIYER